MDLLPEVPADAVIDGGVTIVIYVNSEGKQVFTWRVREITGQTAIGLLHDVAHQIAHHQGEHEVD